MVEYERWTKGLEFPKIPEGVVVRWVYDDDYETQGSFAYDDAHETWKAEQAEIAKLRSGEWVALGCIIEDATGVQLDSLWGIVIDANTVALEAFFWECMEVPTAVEVAQARYDRATTERARACANLIRVSEAARQAEVEALLAELPLIPLDERTP